MKIARQHIVVNYLFYVLPVPYIVHRIIIYVVGGITGSSEQTDFPVGSQHVVITVYCRNVNINFRNSKFP